MARTFHFLCGAVLLNPSHGFGRSIKSGRATCLGLRVKPKIVTRKQQIFLAITTIKTDPTMLTTLTTVSNFIMDIIWPQLVWRYAYLLCIGPKPHWFLRVRRGRTTR